MPVECPPSEWIRCGGEIVVHAPHGAHPLQVPKHYLEKTSGYVHTHDRHSGGDERDGPTPVC